MNKQPSVLIIILNWNGKGFIEDCISSIKENTKYPNHHILVVDNNSSDSSDNTAEDMGAEVIRNKENLGFDIGNNIGIYENPDYDYYFLLNNDTEVKKGWLEEIISTAEMEKSIGIAGPKVLNINGSVQSAGFRLHPLENIHEEENSEDLTGKENVEAIHGCSMLINREVVESIGYLDEIFSLGNSEEWDYCERAKKAGFKVYVDYDSKIIHKEDLTMDQVGSQLSYLLNRKNKIKYELMNGRPKSIISRFYDMIKFFAASLIGYKYNPMSMVLKMWKETIIDLPTTIKKRFKRREYIPSYYCEEVKNYSKRYESLKQ